MIELSFDDGGVTERIQALLTAGGNYRPPLNKFRAYMIGQTVNTFNALRTGGTYRGVTWPYFAHQYRRRDGTDVPAWGGVAYAKQRLTKGGKVAAKQPMVKGKKRPSGKRIKHGDALMQDTRTLMRSVTTGLDLSETSDVVTLWGTRLHYAEKQQKMRKFLFATNRDKDVFRQLVLDHLEGAWDGKPQS